MSEENAKTQETGVSDLQERTKQFNAELMPLLGKYRLGLGAELRVVSEQGAIKPFPVLVDATPIMKKDEDQPKDSSGIESAE